MAINAISDPTIQLLKTQQNATVTSNAVKNEKAKEDSKGDSNEIKDIFERSSESESKSSQSSQSKKTYYADIGRMREIWTEHDRQVESFRKLVDSLIQKQAEKNGVAWDYNDPNAMVDIDEETRQKAQEDIGEGGYFSADSVATRLLDFAVAISGGDPAKIELLRGAVERGFAAAESKWNDKLPEISQETRDKVMNGFDEWAKSGDASSITLLSDSKK